jgi:hypothetical protein
MFRPIKFQDIEKRLAEIKHERTAYTKIIREHKHEIAAEETREVELGSPIEIGGASEPEQRRQQMYPDYKKALDRDTKLATEQEELEIKRQQLLPEHEAKSHATPFKQAAQGLLHENFTQLFMYYQNYSNHLEKMASELAITGSERKTDKAGKTHPDPMKQKILMKLNHIGKMGNAFHSNEFIINTITELQILLGDAKIRADIAQPQKNNKDLDSTEGIAFLKNMDAEMARIVNKLAKFVMPANKDALDYLVVKNMKQLTDAFFLHIQAKVQPLLSKLPDHVMMEIGSGFISNGLKHHLQITHQLKSDLEPWSFSINLMLLKNHIDAFTDHDKYLIQKLDMLMVLQDSISADATTDAEKISDVAKFFNSAAAQRILLTHRKEFRKFFHDAKPPASEKFVGAMRDEIAYQNKIAVILEQPQSKQSSIATSTHKKV